MRGEAREGLVVETVDSLAGLRALEPEWRALEARLPALPFLTFDWLFTWWEMLAEKRLLVRDELFVLSFRDSRGALVGVAPLMLTLRPSVGPIVARQLQLFGADPNLTEVRSLVVAVEDRGRVYSALLRHLQRHSERWDWLLLTAVPQNDELCALVETSFARVEWLRTLPDYTLELPNSFAEFKLSLSRNIKESLRKCYNSLKRNGLTFDFQALSSVDDVEPALAHFFRLHTLRAALPDTVAHPDAFATESSRRFLSAVCRRFAERGKLLLFQLHIGGRIVATRIGFICEDTLYLYFSGYDPAFKQYSVMTTLLAESIRFAIERGLSTVNLSTGRDVSKLRWSPRETLYRDALVVTPSLRGRLTYDLCVLARQAFFAAQQHTHALDALSRRRERGSQPPSDPGQASSPPRAPRRSASGEFTAQRDSERSESEPPAPRVERKLGGR